MYYRSILLLSCVMLTVWTTSSGVELKSKKATTYLLNKPGCTEKRQRDLEMEMALSVPIGTKSKNRFPINYKEVQVYCRDISRMVGKMENFFKECYAKTVRDYANIFIYSTKRSLRKYCGKRNSRVVKEMLKLAPCANDHIRGNSGTIECYRRYMNQTAALINIKADKKKIPHACCYFQEAVLCARTVMTEIPCLRPHVGTLMDYFRTGTSSVTDIMCGDYNDQTDACAKLGPAPKPKTPNTKWYITPTSLLIDLMESMENYVPTLGGSGGF